MTTKNSTQRSNSNITVQNPQSAARQTSLSTNNIPQAPIPYSKLADDIYTLVLKHCIITPHEAAAIVLWSMSSWVLDEFRIFPRLTAISPEKRCGKSTLMEVISAIVKNPLMVSNASIAVISRVAEKMQPTLILDEADTFIKNGDPQLIGLINSGHSKATAQVLKCDGDSFEPRAFSTWMPIVLASIGALPDTIMDRSIPISIHRKKGGQSVTRIPQNLHAQCQTLRDQLEIWRDNTVQYIAVNQVEPVYIGNDRAVDNWLPLFSVASTINPEWENKCLDAYHALTQAPTKNISTQLLEDIRDIFKEEATTNIRSADLVLKLCSDTDKIWATFSHGKRISPVAMANQLSPYGITPHNIRFGEKVARGYSLDQFTDAFERYLA